MKHRSQKIALAPTSEQRQWFAQQCGYARFAFNFALSDFKDGLANDEWRSERELRKRFNARKSEFEWTAACDQRAAAYGIAHLGNAIDRWQDGISRFPKYKRRNARQSYSMEGAKVKVSGHTIRLPKIGVIQMWEGLRFKGRITKVTISRRAHRWFVSITVETEETPEAVDPALPVIGIDVGINTLATLDDGTQYPNPRPLRKYERQLAREQRKLSRKQYLSNNWFKQKRRVERVHYRIACIREDAHHQATTAIVNRARVISIETLKVTNMLKNRKIAKALSDAALGNFLALLKSKAEAIGVQILEAPEFFASSKTCSHCGHKKEILTLSERQYDCVSCGHSVDRDVNAAINLKNLAVGPTESLNACGA